MLAAIQSPLIQRFAPYLAKSLHAINILALALSVLLFTLAWSVETRHSESSAELVGQQTSELLNASKQLNQSQLWFVKEELGGGALLTDQNGTVKNRIGDKQLSVYLATGSVLLVLVSSATLIGLMLLISNNYLRLVVTTVIIVAATYKLQTLYLFADSTDVNTQLLSAMLLLSFALILYCSSHKWLLHNNHVSDTLIAYASQSGSAMSLAKRFKKSITHTTDVRCLSSVDPSLLSRYNEVLIIASTYGEGQPPEKVKSFVRKLNEFGGYVEPMNYSILALGDTHYPHFCAFGHQLEQLLNSKGAKSLFSLVEVDKLDIKAINTWWQGLTSKLNWQADEIKQTTTQLQVIQNQCVNPSQSKRLANRIKFEKEQFEYHPGDLLEVLPKRSIAQSRNLLLSLGLNPQEKVLLNKGLANQELMALEQAMTQLEWHGEQADSAQQLVDALSPIAARVYSIASSPEQDYIEIFVRRYQRPDGNLGVASNYLCDLSPEHMVNASIRTHSNFHLPKLNVPLILIGAGTGIAPLIGFLRHRAITANAEQNWLFFGEQHRKSDFYYQDEIEQMRLENILTKLNLAWSRDESGGYIGEQIEQLSEELLMWINELNAHIYICGNQSGFGESVCAVLLNILGQAQYDQMLQSGKLRTDLY